MKKFFDGCMDLQLFAEGEGEGAAPKSGDGAPAAAEGAAPAAEVQEQQQEKPDRGAAFEALIKGEYKDLYDARVKETVQRRLRGTREQVERLQAMMPMLTVLGQRYGVADESYLIREAEKKGISPDTLRETWRLEREATNLPRQMDDYRAEQETRRIYGEWQKQGEQCKLLYPTFDLEAELQNEDFCRLLRNRVNVQTAYEVIHKDEIIPAAMQVAAQQAAEKVTAAVRANAARPAENGSKGSAASVGKIDVANMTNEQMDDIRKRVLRGERITL
ncbi:MAG: hypothetical protein BHV94_08610 [Clostridiales bacterium 59_14]|nr:MAG: hypothetical protein BHV94_08610 [Clostridiales bacterium 59_14]